MGERVGPHEQQRPATRPQFDHRHRHVQQGPGAQREQLRARDGLDDVEQQLPRMAGIAVGHRQRVVDPAGDQRDLQHVGVHRRDREQADEPVLDRGRIIGVRFLANHHDLRVCAVPQEARNRRLRQRQQVILGGQLRQHILTHPQHPEATRRVHRRLTVAHGATLVAQQDKMPVGQPAQQRRDVLAVRAGEAVAGVAVEFGGQTAQHRGHGGRVERHLARVGQYPRQQLLHFGECASVHRPGQLDVHPGLVGTGAECRIGGRCDVEELTGRTAAHPEHRVHDGLVGDPDAVQQHGDRIHQHRGVVGDDLQCRPEAPGIVRGVHRDAGGARGALTAQPVLRFDQRRRRQLAVRGRTRHRPGDRSLRPGSAALGSAVRLQIGGDKALDDLGRYRSAHCAANGTWVQRHSPLLLARADRPSLAVTDARGCR